MPDDNSRRNFLKKAAYVPPILMSFHAAPSFARPGSVKAPSARPGVVAMPPASGVRSMKPPAGPSNDAHSEAAAQDGGASGSRSLSSHRDPEHQGRLAQQRSVASTSGAGICDGGDVRSFCNTKSGSGFVRDAGGQSPTLSIGDLGDVARSESDLGVMRALFGRLWKSGA
jgi:hypothetical protein